MTVETYAVEIKGADGAWCDDGAVFGPYGYDSQGAAYEAAKQRALVVAGRVVAYSFEFSDSELLEDFSGAEDEDADEEPRS